MEKGDDYGYEFGVKVKKRDYDRRKEIERSR